MARTTVGSETPTLAERFITLFHLPYAVGCILVVALLSLVTITQTGLMTFSSPSGLSNAILGGTFEGCLLYAPRYMRTRLLRAERSIIGLLPGRGGTVSQALRQDLCDRASADSIRLILFDRGFLLAHWAAGSQAL